MTVKQHVRYTLAAVAVVAVGAVSTAVWIAAGLVGDYALSSLAGQVAFGCAVLIWLQSFARWAQAQGISQDCGQCRRPFVPVRDETVCGRCLDAPVAPRVSKEVA